MEAGCGYLEQLACRPPNAGPHPGLSPNLSMSACQQMQALSGEMVSRSSVRMFSCRCCSGLNTKQANTLNLAESPLYVIKKWEPGTHFHEQKHQDRPP